MILERKQQIKQQFNQSAKSYDKHCFVQNQIGEILLNMLGDDRKFTHIVDFACGTGESTLRLIKRLSYDSCWAIDFSEELIAVAREKLRLKSHVNLIVADYETRVFAEQSVDLIFCNMGMQWSSDISKTLSLWKKYLNANGAILFSLPLDHNFPEIKQAYKPNFLSHSDIMYDITENNLTLIHHKSIIIPVSFTKPYDILKYLKATGVNAGSGYKKTKGLKKLVFNDIFIRTDIKQITYHVGLYLVRKKDD